jgi:Rrf2 family transcriptional regulator, iron-sulfur cluster assembly transcription factor
MLSRQASHALKALLELARDPQRWRSSHALAAAEQLPEPMLEQLLLQLRRAGVLEARRGRSGGYRLRRAASGISVAEVMAALNHPLQLTASSRNPEGGGEAAAAAPAASAQVTAALERRLQQALLRTLMDVTVEDLLFDLRSAEAAQASTGGLLLD